MAVVLATRARPLGVQAHEVHASGRKRTVCTTAVLAYLRVDLSRVRYSDKRRDVERHLRNAGYAVRSRMSALRAHGATVGALRRRMAASDEDCHYYVSVEGHAMLLDRDGRTVVDTDPRVNDRRRVVRVSAVFRRPA